MTGNKENIVDVRGLHKYFGINHILKGVDFQVKKGNLVSIIGRSGCGKTTFLRCMNCLEIMDRGLVKIAGISLSREQDSLEDIIKVSKRVSKTRTNISMPFHGYEKVASIDEDFQVKALELRSRVGMVFQAFNLFPNMNVLDNVTKPQMIIKNTAKDQAEHIAVTMLEKVGLEKFTHRMPHQISGGQKQRVAIARALAMNPQVLLYDEPTSSLDPELVDEVTSVMQQLNSEGMTQIVVTHSMYFARNASDYVVYMHDGNIVEQGRPDQIFESPKDQRTRDYLNVLHS